MGTLDTALKVVRLLSALVWLGVGVVTLWGTWITFRDLGPYLRTLTAVIRGAGPAGAFQSPSPGNPSLQDFRGFFNR